MRLSDLKSRSANFRKTEAWERLRVAVMDQAGNRCECPGRYSNGGEPGSTRCENDVEHIHHLVYPIQPDTISIDELIGLCEECHETRHEVNSVLETPPCCRYVHRRSHG